MAIKGPNTVEYEGAVLGTYERNMHDDSDFYAIVWDGEKVTSVGYATTRFPSDRYASVDATPEVIAAAQRWAVPFVANIMRSSEAMRATNPEVKGKRVVVKGGRKYKGRSGVVKVVYGRKSQFGTWTYESRLCIREDDGTEFWVNAGHCEVEDPWDDISAWDAHTKAAEVAVPSMSWYSIIQYPLTLLGAR